LVESVLIFLILVTRSNLKVVFLITIIIKFLFPQLQPSGSPDSTERGHRRRGYPHPGPDLLRLHRLLLPLLVALQGHQVIRQSRLDHGHNAVRPPIDPLRSWTHAARSFDWNKGFSIFLTLTRKSHCLSLPLQW